MLQTREAQIVYRPRPDATPEAELSALAAVYKLILGSKKAAHPGGPDDAEGESKHDFRAKPIIPDE